MFLTFDFIQLFLIFFFGVIVMFIAIGITFDRIEDRIERHENVHHGVKETI